MKIIQLILIFQLVYTIEAAVVEKTFEITQGFTSHDCKKRLSVLVNGSSPGPDIHLNVGDTLRLHVHNKMKTETTSIHFHGIFQRNSPWSDGAPSITQWPILPMNSFTYEFQVPDQMGTFFYHAHSGYQQSTLHGALIIHAKDFACPYQYDEEKTLIVNDLWHRTDQDLIAGLLSQPFKWVGNPQSILFNQKTYTDWECSEDDNSCDTSTCGFEVIKVDPGKTYRIRIISATNLAYLHLGLKNHKMKIIEVDGNYIEPVEVEFLAINSAQRYSVLLEANQPVDNYYMLAENRWRSGTPKNGIAIVHYNGASEPATQVFPEKDLPTLPPEVFNWEKDLFKPLKLDLPDFMYQPEFPESFDREIILTGVQRLDDNGFVRWFMNNVTYEMSPSPILIDYLRDPELRQVDYSVAEDNGGYDTNRKTYPVRYGEVIQVVFQNTIQPNGFCNQHPWHLHGFSFWDLGHGDGLYDPSKDQAKFASIKRSDRPPLVELVTLYPSNNAYFQEAGNPGDPCGYRVVRFIAENPGVWAFHCHFPAHLALGMHVILENAVDRLDSLPEIYNEYGFQESK